MPHLDIPPRALEKKLDLAETDPSKSLGVYRPLGGHHYPSGFYGRIRMSSSPLSHVAYPSSISSKLLNSVQAVHSGDNGRKSEPSLPRSPPSYLACSTFVDGSAPSSIATFSADATLAIWFFIRTSLGQFFCTPLDPDIPWGAHD